MNKFVISILVLLTIAAGTRAQSPNAKSAPPLAAYSFTVSKDAAALVVNTADSHAPSLRYTGSDGPAVVDGRRPGTRVVTLDKGAYVGPAPDVSSQGFAASIWFRKQGQGSHTGNNKALNGTIVAIGDGYYDGWRLTTSYPDKSIVFEIGRPQGSISIQTAAGVSDGGWHCISAAWDGRTMRLYLDGEPTASRDYSGPYTPPPDVENSLHFGYTNNGIGSVLMNLDNAVFYNRAVTSQEIIQAVYPEDRLNDAQAGSWTTANSDFMNRQYARAETEYRDLLSNPNIRGAAASAVTLKLAESLEHQTKIRPAIDAYFHAITEDSSVEQQAMQGLCNAVQNNPGYPIPPAIFKLILKREDLSKEQRLELRLDYGNSLAASAKYPEAIEQYKQLANNSEAEPEWRCTAWMCSARAHLLAGQNALAVNDYHRAKAITGLPPYRTTEIDNDLHRLPSGAWVHMIITRLPPPGLILWVSPSGNDGGTGTKQDPLQTIEGARDKIRLLQGAARNPTGGIVVEIMDGTYKVSKTLTLTTEDGGTMSSPIVYSAAVGAHPIFDAGTQIRGFKQVTDGSILDRLQASMRSRVLQCDLRAQGVTDLGNYEPGGFASARGFKTHPQLEIFFNGTAMPQAGWPNTGVNMGMIGTSWGHPTTVYGYSVLGPGSEKDKDRIHYTGTEPERWIGEPDAWVHGYFSYEWADSYEKIDAIDPIQKTITLAPPVTTYGTPPFVSGNRYRVVNALSELDSPGEWYLDRRSGLLYFYPPSDPAKAVVEVSMLETPVLEMSNVSHVVFRGITWKNGRGDGILVQGGDSCVFEGCIVKQFAGNAIGFDGGKNHGLLSCDLTMLGRGGVSMSGGDRVSLAPSGDFVENCRVDHFSRIDRTYTPAVLVQGVGFHIAHNDLHDGNSSAMRIEGNDNLIEFNNVHDVVLESNDQGGSDMWGDPTYQGNVFRYNYWHDIGRQAGWITAGIRLDDFISGVEIYGNVFSNCADGGFGAVQINRGADNVIENNIFYNCQRAISGGSMSKDDWKTQLTTDFLKSKMDNVDAKAPPYSARYPNLLLLSENPTTSVYNNVVINCKAFAEGSDKDCVGNIVLDADPGFTDAAHGDFRLRKNAPLRNRLNFESVPVEQIGLYADSLR